jgi:PD-(D/E)XK nuclease superfamily
MSVTNYNQSRVKMWRRCQKQYSFRYDYAEYYGNGAGREMVPKVHRLPLYRGTWMHALQEALHHQWADDIPYTATVGDAPFAVTREVRSWKDVHAMLTDEFNKLFLEEKEDLGDLPDECERLFKSYLAFWQDDYKKYSVAEMPDGTPAIELMVEAPLKKFGLKNAQFKGKIDLVVEDDEYEGLWIWDAKWVGKIPPPDERMMSPQALLYVWALREMYDLDVRGFLFNYGRTKPPAIPRVLKRPPGMLSVAHKMDTDLRTYFEAIKQQHGANWKKYMPYYKPKLRELKGREALWFDRQRIPVEDDRILRTVREYCASIYNIQDRETRREYVPRSYFFNCRYGCDYHDLCVSEYQGLDIQPLVKANMRFVGERYVGKEDLLSG